MSGHVGQVLLAVSAAAVAISAAAQQPAPQISARARALHARAIVVDTHDDTTQRLMDEKGFDLGARHTIGSIDIPRMREGGSMRCSSRSGSRVT